MLISCIMPTCNRRHLIPVAVACYKRQDWAERGLVVVDDGTDCIYDLLEDVPNLIYYRSPMRFKTLGEKVNKACVLAKGRLICTWDDDDWSAPDRLCHQAHELLITGRAMSGYNPMLYFDGEKAYQWRGPKIHVAGQSQMYRKELWQRHKMEAVDVGYDTTLAEHAIKNGGLVVADSGHFMVARLHDTNVSNTKETSGKTRNAQFLGTPLWPEVPTRLLPRAFLEAINAATLV